MSDLHGNWHLRKEVSMGTIISLVVLGLGATAGYVDTKAVAQENKKTLKSIEDLPARIIRMEEQLAQLREQQVELKRDLTNSSMDSRTAELAQLKALQEIQVAIAKLQTELNRQGE